MCDDCGCHGPSLMRPLPKTRKIDLNLPVLQINQDHARSNREFFARHGVRAVNLISSPGSGKTSLLQALARRLGPRLAVIVGDLKTDRDAVRIRDCGCQAIQIETNDACHLDARSVETVLEELDLSAVELLVIENVGNLVCPASYDLGEHDKVVLLSTPEGDDKVLKYPSIFSRVSTLVLTKMDLLPHLDFDPERAETECRSLNPDVECLRVSSRTGEGMERLEAHLLGGPTLLHNRDKILAARQRRPTVLREG
ncbi:MAG: hydrogenase nickel incorporation protein HypB [Fibrobacteria bacterium]|nr:hydrogenase nickel incorporation protein HypB [Fibrobacteria bacterium]